MPSEPAPSEPRLSSQPENEGAKKCVLICHQRIAVLLTHPAEARHWLHHNDLGYQYLPESTEGLICCITFIAGCLVDSCGEKQVRIQYFNVQSTIHLFGGSRWMSSLVCGQAIVLHVPLHEPHNFPCLHYGQGVVWQPLVAAPGPFWCFVK